MKQAKIIKRTLTYDERKSIAEQIKNGKMVKQVAADWQIKLSYAYAIFDEFLEWKADWKHKEHEK